MIDRQDAAKLRARIKRWQDRLLADIHFSLSNIPGIGPKEKGTIIIRLLRTTRGVESPHTEREILTYVSEILKLPRDVPGVVVEAGCFKGSSTAKFSIAAKLSGRELVVFDSFEGIPDNDEPHDWNIFGGVAGFKEGEYKGAIDEVKANVAKYGEIQSCRFVKGFFDDTLQHFHEPIAAIYLDVDLASSTKTAIKYLFPLLRPGGALYSQDGHLPLVLDVFNDDKFWKEEVGVDKPKVRGFGKSKLISVVKEA